MSLRAHAYALLLAASLAACSDAPKSDLPVQKDVRDSAVVTPLEPDVIAPELAVKSPQEPVESAAAVVISLPPVMAVKPKPRPSVSPTKFSDGFAKFLRFAPDIPMTAAERKIRKRMSPMPGIERHSFIYETERDGQEFIVTATGENYADPKLKGERLVLVFKGPNAQEARMISYGAQFKCYRNVDPNIWQIRRCR